MKFLSVIVPAALLVGAGALLFASYGRHNGYVPPPPPEVGVAHPVQRSVVPHLDATGTTVAFNSVDLVARIDGFVQSIDYQDGTPVKVGALLFVIEPEPYEAKLQQAQASLAAAQAQYVQADAEFQRQELLGRKDFSSQSAVDQARATRDADKANVANQQAGVALATINLGYTRVVAPFDGVATQHLVSVGDLVGANAATKLASIVQLDPIYASFSISDRDVQRIRADMASEGLTLKDLGKIQVEIGLVTEQGFPEKGVLDYVAPQVDSGTGTLTMRAVVPNPNRTLLPGYFVRVRIPSPRHAAPGLLVPDTALGVSQAGSYLMVVDAQGIVQQRSVQAGELDGGLRVIVSGIGADDQVVVSGLSRAIPGEKVVATPAPPPAS